jgi:hypothetical protein
MIDRSIAAVVQDPTTASRELLLALGGIRRGLFPNAPPYAPETVAEFVPQPLARPV